MGARFRISPAWWSAIFQGVYFTVFMSAWNRHDYHGSWPHTLIEVAIIGVPYTLVMYFTTRKQYDARETLLAGLSEQQRRDALRATRTGTAPADPEARATATALIELRLADLARGRTSTLIVLAVAAVVSALVAIVISWWYAVGVALLGYALISGIRSPAKLRRRLATLQAPPPPAAAAASVRQ